ncbi:hypothetical protein KP509_18G066400 [Ceratopteris richardii]|nr:hypothetical protein KP509_18G066400 [Ceratopteris richardii]
MFKMNVHERDFPAQPYLLSMPPSYPFQLWTPSMLPNLVHAAMPQYFMQAYEQDSHDEGHPDGAQACSSDRSDSPELPSSSACTGNHVHQSASSEQSQEDMNKSGAWTPYNHPGQFAFPMQYPGQPESWISWMQQMQRQMAFLYSMSGCRNGYQQTTPITPNMANQHGSMKAPASSSQQTPQWDGQSTENMQLHATVSQLRSSIARADAEIHSQQERIHKLEEELQTMKARQDAMSETLKCLTADFQHQTGVKRKKIIKAPIAILALPASQHGFEKLQVKKARGLITENQVFKAPNHASEERMAVTQFQATDKSFKDGNRDRLLAVGLDQKDAEINVSNDGKVEKMSLNTENAGELDPMASQRNQDNCSTIIVPSEMRKYSSKQQDLETKLLAGLEYQGSMCSEGAASGGHSQRKEVGNTSGGVTEHVFCPGDIHTKGEVVTCSTPCNVESRSLQAANDCSSGKLLNRAVVIGSSGIEENAWHVSAIMKTSSTKSAGNGINGGEESEMATSRLFKETKNIGREIFEMIDLWEA